MNRGEIRYKVLTHLREDTTAPVRWTAEEVNRYIDDGYREMSELTGSVVRTDTITLPGNTNFYSLPSDCLYPLAIQEVTKKEPLDPVHWLWFDDIDGIWIRTRRTSPEVYAAFGMGKLIFYPAPTADRTLTLYQTIIPSGITSDASSPDFPEQFHAGLVEYVIFRCLLKEVTDGEALGRARRHHSYYLMHLQNLDTWALDRHPNMRINLYSERLRHVSGGFSLGS